MSNTDHISLERATQLLKQILSAHSPELGARLKQRLSASLREQGVPPFDERALGYKSFTAFLEKTQADWLQVIRPTDGPGDVLISLRSNSSVTPTLPGHSAGVTHQFRNEVWQAFTNPDPSRSRYLHKKTGHLLHFKLGDSSPLEAAYTAAPHDYLEIDFVDGERQRQWMEEFLNAVPIVGDERQAYDSMISAPFSTAMNSTFARSLGDKQEQWREFRTPRVAAAILEWSSKHSLPTILLERGGGITEAAPTLGHVHTHVAKPKDSARQDALKLIELLTDQEINSTVIPMLLKTMLLRRR